MRSRCLRFLQIVICLLMLPQDSAAQYLTGESDRDPLEISMGDLQRNRASLGLDPDDIAGLVVRDRHRNARTGTTHLYLRQHLDGIEVFGGDLNVSIDRRGRMLARGDRLARNLRARAPARRPRLGAGQALLRAAEHLGLPEAAPPVRRRPGGAAQELVFAPGELSRDEIPAKLMYVPRDGGELRLAWNLVIRTPDGQHWWNLHVDALDGSVLRKDDWIANEAYRVFALPQKSPDEGPQTLVSGQADATASPFGWHDTNGVSGAEFTDTRGNNVSASEDADGDDIAGARPVGGPSLEFDFLVNASLQPSNYREAAITNLFYWNNLAHDLFYRYGFDEAAGNFQTNNYGRGGVGGDAVVADAQDGSGTNNANFGTPPEGSAPRMQMFRWLNPAPAALTVHSPPAIAGGYPTSGAQFGGGSLGLTDGVVYALPNDACAPLSNPGAIAGNIALIDRGTCFFVEKVARAQQAGASGAIIVNNAGDGLVNMSGFDPNVTISAVFIGQSNGALIKAQLGAGVNATLANPPSRDSDLDSGVILHEYAHGVTNRLTGGASNVSCLDQAQSAGMGEGWSDLFALVFTAETGDQPGDLVEIAPYLVFQPPTGAGIRNFPYSTDIVASPLTYADLSVLNQPHGVGEVWASALWQMHWNLVNAYGFDSDLYDGTGGNNLAIRLVMDALSIQPCNPTFLAARNAVLSADLAETGGANECLIWSAFAKRGLGTGATDGGGVGSLGVTEHFGVPAQCTPDCGDSTLQEGEQCDDGNASSVDGCSATCQHETIVSLIGGTAQGGTVDLVIAGVSLQIVTVAGESAVDVAANLAAAINANPTLAGLGITADSFGVHVGANGTVTLFEINDAGLGPEQIPLSSAVWLALLGALLLLAPRTRRRA